MSRGFISTIPFLVFLSIVTFLPIDSLSVAKIIIGATNQKITGGVVEETIAQPAIENEKEVKENESAQKTTPLGDKSRKTEQKLLQASKTVAPTDIPAPALVTEPTLNLEPVNTAVTSPILAEEPVLPQDAKTTSCDTTAQPIFTADITD